MPENVIRWTYPSLRFHLFKVPQLHVPASKTRDNSFSQYYRDSSCELHPL